MKTILNWTGPPAGLARSNLSLETNSQNNVIIMNNY